MHVIEVRGGVERARLHHGKVLDAIEERDPIKAREATRAHLTQVRDEGPGLEIPPELAPALLEGGE